MSMKDFVSPQPLSFYRDLVEASDDLFFRCDSDGRYVYLNPAWEKKFGYRLEEMLGRKSTDFQPIEYAERDSRELLRMLQGTDIKGYETTCLSKSGKEIHLRVTAKTVRDDAGTIVGAAGTAYDITERKQTQRELRDQQNLLANLATQVPGMLYQFKMAPDGSFSVPYSSNGIREIFGCSPEDVRDDFSLIFEAIHPDDRKKILETINSSAENMSQWMCEYRVKRPKKPVIWVYGNSIPEKMPDGSVVWSGYNMDITERKTAEEMLLKTQKLDAIGVLAGGIAHDFNNLLGGIFGYIDMAAELSKDDTISNCLAKSLETIDRARSLTSQLLTFSKGGTPYKKPGSLFPLVRETALFALRGSSLECRFDVPGDLWLCDIDAHQIEQVIDNIVINARQAMPAGGVMEVSAKNIVIDKSDNHALPRGRYVQISIRDFGTGIPKEALSHIFDPFYTTKPKGHGLGLATSYSIIKQHGGFIDVDSVVGRGSTFRIHLPASSESRPSQAPDAVKRHHGEGTILVLDDEPVLLDTYRHVLESFGYQVICLRGGTEALNFLKSPEREQYNIAGMIFDLTIPGDIGGKELAAEIRTTDITTPLFVASGYAEDPVMADPLRYGFNGSISKPFRKADLANLLNQHMP